MKIKKVIGELQNPNEFIGELLVIDDRMWIGLIVEKSGFLNTRSELRNDRPVWTVDWYVTPFGPQKNWYERKMLEKLFKKQK